MVVSEGNTVMYPTGSGNTVTLGDQEHLILTEDQILAIVD
jgi:co-chaperonin GroES (HSP10)